MLAKEILEFFDKIKAGEFTVQTWRDQSRGRAPKKLLRGLSYGDLSYVFFRPTFHAKSLKPILGDFNGFPPDFRRLSIHFDRFSIVFNQFQSGSVNSNQF